MKLSEIQSIVENFDSEAHQTYWEKLAHNLTVSCRCIWSDDEYTDFEKIEGMEYINEVLHRITARITMERKNLHEWTDDDMFKTIASWASKAPKTKGYIAWALKVSLPDRSR